MATSLGSLVVSLGLNAAEFTTGLTKSEREAKRFARSIDKGIAQAVNLATIALAGMTTAAIATFAAVDQLAKQAGNFKDLEEITGANAESLASFAVAAATAGTDMNTIADASVKLTKSLTGVDDESKAAGAALAALGLNIKEFKALDPATQMETVAKALAGFEDGAGKTAVAVALLGKSGAQLLPFLKELAAEGGRQVILTQKQIEQADEYADKQSRVRAELNLYAQVAATQTLPAISALTEVAKDYIKELVNIDNQSKNLREGDHVASWAEHTATVLGFLISSGEGAARVLRLLADTVLVGISQTAAVATGNIKEAIRLGEDFKKRAQESLESPLFSTRLADKFGAGRRENSLRNVEDRGFKPAGRQLDFAGAAAGSGKAAKAAKDLATEADRYLESLKNQLERTFELTNAQKVLFDLERGRLDGLKEGQLAIILGIAQELDAYEALKKGIEESKRAQEDANKAAQQVVQERAAATKAALDDAERVLESNNALRDEIAIIVGGDSARKALEKDYVALAIARKEDALAAAQQTVGMEGVADALKLEIEALKERSELLVGKDFAEQMAKEAQTLQDVKNMFSDSFADAFSDVITGTKSVKDAFKSLADDIFRQISRIAAQNLANAIFGGTNSAGPDIFGMIGKLFGMMGGGTTGGGFSGGGFGEHFAMGGISRGGWATVGEHGPEVVNLPRGAQVIPNHRLSDARGGDTFIQNLQVPARAPTQTIRHAAKQGWRAASGTARRG